MMFNRMIRQLTFLMGFCCALATSSAFGQNLAQNPGFESGNTSAWFGFGAVSLSAQSSVVRSGGYAAFVQNRTAGWNGIAQSMLTIMQPGQSYNVSVWVRLPSGSTRAQLTMRETEGGTTSYFVVSSTTVSSSWTQLSGQYSVSAWGSFSERTLYVELPDSATGSFYADDLLVQLAATGPSGTGGQTAINWNGLQQRIDGFGASSAWRSQWTSTQVDMLFSTNSGTGTARNGTTFSFAGVGLSLLRSRIVPGATTVEQTIMQMAQARGARVWSAPWSPATQFKSNGNVNGGNFVGNAANYRVYASQLAGYVAKMKSQYGVDIYALSIQNEPDADVTTYESCNWTAQQIHDFIPYLSSALSASNVAGTKIMLPESQNWTDPRGLGALAMNDSSVASLVGIIANHNYVPDNANGDQMPPTAIQSHGKALWQTEVAKLSGEDSSIEDGLYWAGRVHQFLAHAQANAWHYWWLYAYGGSNQGLCDTNEVPAKRMYTLGNFSRFVRPGFHRMEVSSTGSLVISAYRSLTNGSFAIVAINPATNGVVQTFSLDGVNCASVTPWVTSAGLSLAPQSPVGVTGNQFAYDIPLKSVVTFTGMAAPLPLPRPSFSSVMPGQNQISLSVTGALGPDYTLLASTNMANWTPVCTTNPTSMPITMVDTNQGFLKRFYRIQLGP